MGGIATVVSKDGPVARNQIQNILNCYHSPLNWAVHFTGSGFSKAFLLFKDEACSTNEFPRFVA